MERNYGYEFSVRWMCSEAFFILRGRKNRGGGGGFSGGVGGFEMGTGLNCFLERL
jgi:hypothetical protein